MCNAWNHSENCTCGWGGQGFSNSNNGSGSVSMDHFFWVPKITHSYQSYINPNAFCPVCSQSVFFYQSSNGGRVFFDELGPPWPKHPCTNKRSEPKNIASAKPRREIEKYKWELEGWSPYFVTSVSRFDKDRLKVEGTFAGLELVLYLDHKRSVRVPSNVNIDCLWQIKQKKSGSYDCSIITENGFVERKFGFKVSFDARN